MQSPLVNYTYLYVNCSAVCCLLVCISSSASPPEETVVDLHTMERTDTDLNVNNVFYNFVFVCLFVCFGSSDEMFVRGKQNQNTENLVIEYSLRVWVFPGWELLPSQTQNFKLVIR